MVMQRTKVVFCAYDNADGRVGGPIAWACDLLPFLADGEEFEVTVLLLQYGEGEGKLQQACCLAGLSLRILDMAESIYMEDQISWILSQCRAIQPGIFIANLVLPALYAMRELRRAGVKTLSVIHSDPHQDVFYRDVITQFVMDPISAADVTVCVSESIGKHVHAVNSRAKTTVIPCGCRANVPKATRPNDDLKLIYVGRIVQEQKRIRETVESLIAATNNSRSIAALCGTGDEADWLKQRLSSQNCVTWLGQLSPEKLPLVISQYHVIVLLSDYEGLPIALVEGMASGLVPIGLRSCPGVNEVIKHGVNGLLVDDRGQDFLSKVSLLHDFELWQQLSNNAIETVRQHYSHEVTFQKWEETLRSLAGSPQKPVKIRRHQRLPSRNGLFADYPPNLPSMLTRARCRFQRAVSNVKLALRPRDRLRKLLNNDRLFR